MSIISEEELQEIVEVVWMTSLELPVVAGQPSDMEAGGYLTAVIDISGAWQGLVSLKASKQFLNHAASVMFSADIPDITDQDCSDTLMELTNMLGGTVKCLLPETCDLALPRIIRPDSNDNTQQWSYFCCDDHPLAVSVCESSVKNQAA